MSGDNDDGISFAMSEDNGKPLVDPKGTTANTANLRQADEVT
jgi:hypothetical protein